MNKYGNIESFSNLDFSENDIAIIGMAGIFPDADNVDDFWQNLLKGHQSIRKITKDELLENDISNELIQHPYYVPWCSSVENAEYFDAKFFGISDMEAYQMDPQQRLFIQNVWRGLEDAGHAGDLSRLRIGIFGATTASTYLHHVAPQGVWSDQGLDYSLLISNDKDFLATRSSYILGLTGPSMTIQSACSSSLAALHTAKNALLQGDCEIAVVGGVSITFPQQSGYLYKEGGILSSDGYCRVFSQQANGTIKGNGVAVVVLRRIQDSLADKDSIYALITASAINNDGADKISFTAPSIQGQEEVLKEALDLSKFDRAQIQYIEAHGTGTKLGDPIEVQSLARVYRYPNSQSLPVCYLGSLKANIGHLDTAAGVAGLIKASLILKYQKIPVQINAIPYNSSLQLDKYGFKIADTTVQLTEPIKAAAVSAFGIGGTNIHVILKYSQNMIDRPPAPCGDYRFIVSANNSDDLLKITQELLLTIQKTPTIRLDDLALTLCFGRKRYSVAGLIKANSIQQLCDELIKYHEGHITLDNIPEGEVKTWLGDCRFALRISIPGYPLSPKRYWPNKEKKHHVELPHSPMKEKIEPILWKSAIERIFAKLLKKETIESNENLFNLGLDSIDMVEAVTAIRDQLGINITLEEISTADNIEQILQKVNDISNKLGHTTSPVVSRSTKSAVTDRLLKPLRLGRDNNIFLIPPAGGTSLAYKELIEFLPDDFNIYSFSYPIRIENKVLSIRQLAARFLEEIVEIGELNTSILAGYSFGGNVAFETTCQLERKALQIKKLLLIDSHAPLAYLQKNNVTPDYDKAFLYLLPQIFPNMNLPNLRLFEGLSVSEILNKIGGDRWSKTMQEELYNFFLIWCDNHLALKQWYPDTLLKTPVILIKASDDEQPVVLDALNIIPQPAESWNALCTTSVETYYTTGDHYSILRDSYHLKKLARIMTNAIK